VVGAVAGALTDGAECPDSGRWIEINWVIPFTNVLQTETPVFYHLIIPTAWTAPRSSCGHLSELVRNSDYCAFFFDGLLHFFGFAGGIRITRDISVSNGSPVTSIGEKRSAEGLDFMQAGFEGAPLLEMLLPPICRMLSQQRMTLCV